MSVSKNTHTNKHTHCLLHMQIHTLHTTQTLSGRTEGWIDEGERRRKRDRYSSDRQRDGWTEGWRE